MNKTIILITFSFLFSAVYAQIIPVRNANGNNYDYIDTVTKKIISKYAYDQANPFSEGMARVNRNGLFGFINTNGEEVIPCKYLHATDFGEGVASVSIGKQEIEEYFVSIRDEKYGVIDSSGKKIISFAFGGIANFKNGIARARDLNSKKWGWIDKMGSWKINPKFSDANDFNEDGMAKISLSYDSVGYIDIQGNYLINPIYYVLGDFVDGLALAKNWGEKEKYLGKYGFINIKGETMIPFKYDKAQEFSENLALVGKSIGDNEIKFGFIDKKGFEQIAINYEYAHSFSNGMAFVKQNNKYGWINVKGNYVIPNIYDLAEDFDYSDFNKSYPAPNRAVEYHNNFKNLNTITYKNVMVSNNGFFGVVDNKGKEIIPVKYDLIARTKNGFIVNNGRGNICFNNSGQQIDLEEKGKAIIDQWQWLNNRGSSQDFTCESYNNFKEKINLDFSHNYSKVENYSIFSFRQNLVLCRVENNGKWGVVAITKDGLKEIIQPIYEDVGILPGYNYKFHKYEPIPVKQKGLWGFADPASGQIKIPFQFQNVGGFNDMDGSDLCQVKKNNKWGIINSKGELITPFIYEDALCYAHGLCAVKKDGKWGFINRYGGVVSPCLFDWVTIHYEWKSYVKLNKMEIVIDEYGNWIY